MAEQSSGVTAAQESSVAHFDELAIRSIKDSMATGTANVESNITKNAIEIRGQAASLISQAKDVFKF